MIDFREIKDGETWELFGRDFLNEIGFYIETHPDRGADHGKDILVTERLSGKLGEYKFRWLVSCKHFATSKKSVNENDERNILERVKSFNADGFLGFYSTIASSNLNSRLYDLKQRKEIKDFKIFDHKLIENHIIRKGFSRLLIRYFPQSYRKVKPLHSLSDEYLPLKCDICGSDLLYDLYHKQYKANIVFVKEFKRDDETLDSKIVDVYWACKMGCEDRMQNKFRGYSTTGWDDIGDLIIPSYYIDWVFTIMNCLKFEKDWITEEAFEKLKYFIIALGQKVFREMTESEKDRAKTLFQLKYNCL